MGETRCKHGLPEGQCAACLVDPDIQNKKLRDKIMGNNGEMQICKDCGERPAMLNKNGKVVNGKCGMCQAKALREARQKKKAAEEEKTERTPKVTTRLRDVVGTPSETDDGNGRQTLFLVMDEHPAIMEKLKQAAEVQVRTPELQALFYIKRGLETDKMF